MRPNWPPPKIASNPPGSTTPDFFDLTTAAPAPGLRQSARHAKPPAFLSSPHPRPPASALQTDRHSPLQACRSQRSPQEHPWASAQSRAANPSPVSSSPEPEHPIPEPASWPPAFPADAPHRPLQQQSPATHALAQLLRIQTTDP